MADLFNLNQPNINWDNQYYSTQIITYLGNKRNLLPFLNLGFEKVQRNLGKKKLSVLDGFCGSGVVSRLLKSYANHLYSNDLEEYSYICNKCYLSNKSEIDIKKINNTIDLINAQKQNLKEGFITKNYTPQNDNNIQPRERVFYTHKNGMILDTFKKWIYSNILPAEQCFYLAPLIVKASIHTNTSGVFKGFHKKDGIRHRGGSGDNALKRILGEVSLDYPIFGFDECSVHVTKEDINHLIKRLPEIDLAYFDPPYNQHPYGSNYFMLNILANPQEEIPIQSGISGISLNWNRSNYNKKQSATESLNDLIKNTPAKYILLSYNNEGIIPFETIQDLLKKYGEVQLLQQKYNTYRGSRNLRCRNNKVKEFLWIVKKKE